MTDDDLLAMIRSFESMGYVEVTKAGGDTFEAIFDNGYAEAAGDIPVEASSPFLSARTVDVASLVKNTLLTINGTPYRLARHEPDGTGMTRVVLKIV